jgi:processing peptidase subunit alpha
VFVDAGSRYESPKTQGCSHLLDRMAFKSTAKRDHDQMLAEMEVLGGNLSCSSARECLMYQAAVFKQDIPHVVDLLADVIRSPRLTEQELEEQRETVPYELNEIWSKPDLILPELFHQAAYQGNTLGNPLLCAPERLESMSVHTLDTYRRRWYHPGRVVLAGTGVEHEELVALAEQYFGDWQRTRDVDIGPDTRIVPLLTTSPTPKDSTTASSASPKSMSMLRSLSSAATNIFKKNSTAIDPNTEDPFVLATAPARYTGGEISLEVPEQENTFLYLGFESVGLGHTDMYTLATLQLLLGGGGSFSAGGPGKGMYSRLYTRVLNRYHWVESCVAFLHGYSDSGLFGISAACRPDWAPALGEVMIRELALLCERGTVDPSELSRAKNQLKSSVLMNLESRMVQLEDLARQIQIYGRRIPVEEMCQHVDAVTLDDVHRVARQLLLNRPPTLVAYGPLQQLGDIKRTLRKYGIGQ